MACLFSFGFVRERRGGGKSATPFRPSGQRRRSRSRMSRYFLRPNLPQVLSLSTLSAMTMIFNPPITWPEDLEDFGEAEIATLASAFKDHLVRVAPKREGELDEQLRKEWEDWLDLVGPSARRPI